MRSLRKSWLPAAALGLCLALAPLAPATAQGDGAPNDSPSELAREALEQLMRALSLLVDSIPQYEMPEVLENGDIIIRRKHGDAEPPAGESEIDETAT
ncbi:MAG: hypothetical protein ACFCUW_05060 [Kiloniellaceae bacterium]